MRNHARRWGGANGARGNGREDSQVDGGSVFLVRRHYERGGDEAQAHEEARPSSPRQVSGVAERVLEEVIGQRRQHARPEQQRDVVPRGQGHHPAALRGDLEYRPVPQIEREGDGSEEREGLAPEQALDPPLGLRRAAAMTRPAPKVGMATSAPGYTLDPVSVTLATRITASPTQDATAAQACGIRLKVGPCTAMSPPRASSQDRVSSEKYALSAFTDVSTIDNA